MSISAESESAGGETPRLFLLWRCRTNGKGARLTALYCCDAIHTHSSSLRYFCGCAIRHHTPQPHSAISPNHRATWNVNTIPLRNKSKEVIYIRAAQGATASPDYNIKDGSRGARVLSPLPSERPPLNERNLFPFRKRISRLICVCLA